MGGREHEGVEWNGRGATVKQGWAEKMEQEKAQSRARVGREYGSTIEMKMR